MSQNPKFQNLTVNEICSRIVFHDSKLTATEGEEEFAKQIHV